jgi:hypothetical protein
MILRSHSSFDNNTPNTIKKKSLQDQFLDTLEGHH